MPKPERVRIFNTEGDDASGKQTLVLEICRALLNYFDKDIILMSFPSYWGSGQFIRRMNRGAADELFQEMDAVQETELRMAAYALDRTFSLAMLLRLIEDSDSPLIVSDRGPLSNAVTLGYKAAESNLPPVEISKLAKLITTLDQEFISSFQWDSILCEADEESSSSFSSGERIALDKLETLDDRTIIKQIYRDLLPNNILTTRAKSGWRPVSTLAREALTMIDFQVPEHPHYSELQSLRSDRLKILGSDLFFATFIKNNKHILPGCKERDRLRREVFINSNNPFLKQADKHLDDIEQRISANLLSTLNNDTVEFSLDIPHPAVASIRRLINQYPLLISLIEVTLGDNSHGLIRLISHIQNLEIEV